MPTQVSSTLAEAQIRQLIDGWVNAVRARDLKAITANYAKDVMVFDAVPPLRYRGTDAYRKNWEECFAMMQGPIGYEIRELSITADDELAFSHSVNRLSGTEKNGKNMEMWFRATVCFRKEGGKWLVTHEHASVPFYPNDSMKAATDLKP
jgi:uncharacterized protein (TIGR02246 family)